VGGRAGRLTDETHEGPIAVPDRLDQRGVS